MEEYNLSLTKDPGNKPDGETLLTSLSHKPDTKRICLSKYLKWNLQQQREQPNAVGFISNN